MRIFLKNFAWYILSVLVGIAIGCGLLFLTYKAYGYIFTNVIIEGKYFDQFTADLLTVLFKPLGIVIMVGEIVGIVWGTLKVGVSGLLNLVKDTIRENRERKLAQEAIDRTPHISPDHLRSAPRDSVHAHTPRNDRTAPQHFTHGYRSLDHER